MAGEIYAFEEKDTGDEDDVGEVSDDDKMHDGEADQQSEGEEAPKVKVWSDPGKPTKEKIEQHEATHAQYRSWCPHCVKGRGQSSPHKAIKDRDPDALPEVSMDFYFAGEKDNPTATMLG